MKKAVFLDRDGTLNYDSEEYVKSEEELKVFDFAGEAVKRINKKNYLAIIITNQSGVGRDYFSEDDLYNMNRKLIKNIEKKGGEIEEIFYCPHHPDDGCSCRKPGIDNIKKAQKKFDIDLSSSYFIGDSKKDIEAGNRSGCKTIFVKTGIKEIDDQDIKEWNTKPDFIAKNVLEATKNI